MIDTIELMSPELSLETVSKIRMKSMELQRINMETGELNLRITTSSLSGSYDSRLSVQVLGTKIKVSGSVHKFILGHNCFGGPTDLHGCCRYLVNVVSKYMGVGLPSAMEWEIMRIDIAHCFDLGSIEQAETYIHSIRSCSYPRRKAFSYGQTGMYFKGASTTLKIYLKGPEFRKHDYYRLKKFKNFGAYESKTGIKVMEALADRLVRFEVEVRKRKIRYDKRSNLVKDMDIMYLEQIYKNEVSKLFREAKEELEVVKDIIGVKERLQMVYPGRKGNNMFSVWTRIQVEGEQEVKKSVGRRTWYRYKKDLAAAGVGLTGAIEIKTMVQKDQYCRIYDFVPLPGTRYHVSGKFTLCDEIMKQMELTA
jgi:II/X family phage/plasmid replication protein